MTRPSAHTASMLPRYSRIVPFFFVVLVLFTYFGYTNTESKRISTPIPAKIDKPSEVISSSSSSSIKIVYDPAQAQAAVRELVEKIENMYILANENHLKEAANIHEDLPTWCPDWSVAGVNGKKTLKLVKDVQNMLDVGKIKYSKDTVFGGGKCYDEAQVVIIDPFDKPSVVEIPQQPSKQPKPVISSMDEIVQKAVFPADVPLTPPGASIEDKDREQQFVAIINAMYSHVIKGDVARAKEMYLALTAKPQNFTWDEADRKSMQAMVDSTREVVRKFSAAALPPLKLVSAE